MREVISIAPPHPSPPLPSPPSLPFLFAYPLGTDFFLYPAFHCWKNQDETEKLLSIRSSKDTPVLQASDMINVTIHLQFVPMPQNPHKGKTLSHD